MPSVLPWRFLLNRLSDNLSFYATFRDAVSTGVWSNLSNFGRERYLKSASFHLQYKINELGLKESLEYYNSIYRNKLPSFLAFKSLFNRCLALLSVESCLEESFFEIPKQLCIDFYNNAEDAVLKHLLEGELLHKFFYYRMAPVNILESWISNLNKIENKRILVLSLFYGARINSGNVPKQLMGYATELVSEDFSLGEKYLLLYILVKLQVDIEKYKNLLEDLLNSQSASLNPLNSCLAIEALYLLKNEEINVEYLESIERKEVELWEILETQAVKPEILLQILLDFSLKSPFVWQRIEQLSNKAMGTHLFRYLLSHAKPANAILSTSKSVSTSVDDKDLFLEMAKKYRLMIKGKIVKVEPCGLYIEMPVDKTNSKVVGYVDITTFPENFDERLDHFFKPSQSFHVRIVEVPEDYSDKLEDTTVLKNKILIKSKDNAITLEPSNVNYDIEVARKNGNVRSKSTRIAFEKGEVVDATPVICDDNYQWALFQLQSIKTGLHASKLGLLDTEYIRGDSIQKLKLLRKIEKGETFKIKVTGTTGPLYALNHSKLVRQ